MLGTILIIVLIIMNGGALFAAPAPWAWTASRVLDAVMVLGLLILLVMHLTGKV